VYEPNERISDKNQKREKKRENPSLLAHASTPMKAKSIVECPTNEKASALVVKKPLTNVP
jgi:hypothetical protein